MEYKNITIITLVSLLIFAFTTAPDNQDVQQDKTIVSIASNTASLSTLVKAVKAAGLVETLNSKGPFTVFAPTNEAFAALPEGTLEMLLKPENKDKLKSILTYHVVSGKVMSSDLKNGQMVKTVQGAKAKIMLDDKAAMVNGAKVVKADIEASNGVVHVINKVMMPSDNMKEDMMEHDEKEDHKGY